MSAIMTNFDIDTSEAHGSRKWEGLSELDQAIRDNRLTALIRDDVVLREINRWRQRAFEQAECLRCVYFIAWDREACGCDGGARTFSGTAALAMSGRA